MSSYIKTLSKESISWMSSIDLTFEVKNNYFLTFTDLIDSWNHSGKKCELYLITSPKDSSYNYSITII